MVKILLGTLTLILSFGYERSGCAYLFPAVNAANYWKASTNAKTQSSLFASAASDTPDGPPQEPSEPCSTASNRLLASSPNTESYHLIWSPGAWKKLLTGSVTLFLAHGVQTYLVPHHDVATWVLGKLPINSLTSNLVLPLLASSCCLVQLGMNALSIGCGGFNSLLGPVRPYFMSALVYLTFLGTTRSGGSMRWAALTILRWSIALLPEVIDLWNTKDQTSAQRRHIASAFMATVELDIPAMGCVGCIQSVNSALREIPGVDSASSSLKPAGGGQAQVRIAADSEADVKALVDALTTAVSSAGFFGSTVESVDVQRN